MMPLFLDRLLAHRAHHGPLPEVLRQGVLKRKLAGSILDICPEPENSRIFFYGEMELLSGEW